MARSSLTRLLDPPVLRFCGSGVWAYHDVFFFLKKKLCSLLCIPSHRCINGYRQHTAGGNPVRDLPPIRERVAILPAASCCQNRDNLQCCKRHGSYCSLISRFLTEWSIAHTEKRNSPYHDSKALLWANKYLTNTSPFSNKNYRSIQTLRTRWYRVSLLIKENIYNWFRQVGVWNLKIHNTQINKQVFFSFFTTSRRPYWCTKKILWELNYFSHVNGLLLFQ